MQEYALVVSYGNGSPTNALTLTEDRPTLSAIVHDYTIITNMFPESEESPTTGGLLLHQHVGANTPLLGTNTVPWNVANGVITLGLTNQWHFYSLSNEIARRDHSHAGQGKVVAAQMWLDGRSMIRRVTDGATIPTQEELTTNKENFNDPIFPDAATKYGQWRVAMPSDYDGGTISAKFYWRSTSASTNVVRWGLRAISYADSDALDAAFGTAQLVDDANQAANDLNISAATAAITIAGGPAAGDLVIFEAYREGGHANDTLAADAKLSVSN